MGEIIELERGEIPAIIADTQKEQRALTKADYRAMRAVDPTDPDYDPDAPRRPDALPTRYRKDPPRRVLAEAAALQVVNLHWGINEAWRQYSRLTHLAEQQDGKERLGYDAAAVRYLDLATKSTLKALALTIGTTVNVRQTQGQEGLPKWEALPAETRAKLGELFDTLTAAGVDVASLLGARDVTPRD